MTKKKYNIDEFDALSQDEQNEILDEIKEKLGDAVVSMNMYVPSEMKEWWDKLCKKDGGGRLAYEMLLSNFFILSMAIAVNEGEQAFRDKTAIAQLVMTKEMVYKNGKIYIGSSESIAKETGDCVCDDCTCDDTEGGNHGGNNTFH